MDYTPSHFSMLPSSGAATTAAPPMHTASGSGMGMSGGKNSKVGGIEHQGWRRFLRDRYPSKTAEAVSADIGISANTVDKWLRGIATPSFDGICALLAAYGPEFAAACVPGSSWFAGPARDARRARLGSTIAKLEAERDQLLEAR